MRSRLRSRLESRLSSFGHIGSPATAPTLQDLFANGEAGALYTPWVLSTMWQDTAGTTPAEVDAVVKRIDDQSGNGNNATQADTGKSPILRQSGSLYYLEFDGVDDVLVASSVASGDFKTVMLAAETTTDNPTRVIGMGTTGYYCGDYQNDSIWYVPSEGSGRTGVGDVWPDDTVSVVSFVSDESNVDSYVDGVKNIDNATTQAVGSSSLRLGGNSTPSFHAVKIFGVIVRSVVTSDADRQSAEAILAAKAGVTL